jgi:hypothetical protein
VVVGATREDSNATGVNGNQADNSAADSGAAYVFTVRLDSVQVCHANRQTLTVNDSALAAHLKHGDTVGPCAP